ncbi:unnamed protein product, partial [Haemonchus placei]|uniref:DUF5641 domain-containing protein n=1 Tax=Haemonchus placei TaxID=6290 RepID=A0A0N4WUX3_HAEPC
KKSLKHSIKNRLLHIEDIRTFIKETEAIVNTRPLTYVTDEVDYFPLRPTDFLRPNAQLSGPYPQDVDWTHSCELLKNFWERWVMEYLTSLREQYKNDHFITRTHETDPPKKGDYELINDPNLDRGQWKMGQIVGSRDEFKRSVEIRLPSRKVITRHHNLIYKMEIPHTDEVPSSTLPPLRLYPLHIQ